jgi:7-cyano-7-deazaguanine synthase in queuosine biosynthesis
VLLVRCDDAVAPAQLATASWDMQKSITSRGPASQLTLRAQSLAGTVLTRVANRAADLVRVAAYIYAADQELSRGGPADVYGQQWRWSITLCVPVADPAFWQQDLVQSCLANVVSFLTDDHWDFCFSPGSAADQQIALDVREDAVMQYPNVVVLFSGGADSLCTAVEAVAEQGARPVLVSHRSAPNVDSRQRALVDAMRQRFPQWAFAHLSFWIHRRGAEAADSSQRSRAFLFASLRAAVASELGIARVLLGDNGIVSLNLPINGQLVGTLASRSTHPTFISMFNDFVSAVLPTPVRVSNPLQFQTRPEVLGILAHTGHEALLQETNSCSRGRGRPLAVPHCGYCSQCVDRRFGSIAAGLEEHDLAEGYELDIFTHVLPEGEARTVAESYVRFARDIDALPDDGLFDAYPQLSCGPC